MPSSIPRPAAPKPATVAIIDDHTLIRHLLVNVLKGEAALKLEGSFASAREGIAGCLRLKPRVIIIDWKLRDGNGIDVVRALAPKLRGTRFLFLSGAAKSFTVRRACEANVHGFVMKDATYDTLLHAIRTVAAGKKYLCATSTQLLVESVSGPGGGPASVTPRECDILQGLQRGYPVKRIASDLGLTAKAIYNRLGLLKDKLGIYDIPGLVRFAVEHGIVDEF